MLTDITLKLTLDMITDSNNNTAKSLVGHLGTHFDVMDKEFPLDYTKRRGIVFDVSGVLARDIEIADIDLDRVERDSFVAFYTGYCDREIYGTREYFSNHPQLSHELIDALLSKEVSIIGVDFAGIDEVRSTCLWISFVPTKTYLLLRIFATLRPLLTKVEYLSLTPIR